jgi:hypothetical protein
VCDDGSCARRTQQQSVLATVCLSRGCHGHMNMEYNERALHTQLKYLETLFDVKWVPIHTAASWLLAYLC